MTGDPWRVRAPCVTYSSSSRQKPTSSRRTGACQGYQAESVRVDGLTPTRALLIAELERSFDHLSRSLAGMSDAARAADGRTFGRDMKVDAGITLALSDMHEHLGQLIAYARMNRIVPPWSQ
jgi:hypothetical protein